MANVIRLKRASGSDPAASDLVSGEPAVRTDTGELFFKKDDGSVAKVSGAGGGPDFKYLALRNAANNGAASYPNADFTLVTSGTTNALTPTAANTLLVSVNGVIQKPNTGTSTPSSGFALSGSTIKFGGNISAAPDFILYQESGGIGEPSDATVSEAKLNVSNSPVNGYFLSAQSGNTGGLTWAAPVATSCTGNSATATALATARAINGVNFDGTAAITVTAAAGTLSGNTLNSSVTASSLTSLGDLAGLTVDGDATFTGANYNVLWDKSDNALEFADNAKAVFGTGADLQIFWDGSHARLTLSGGGNFNIQSDDFQITDASNTTVRFRVDADGATSLRHNGSQKLETTSTGISVTGNINSTGHVALPDNSQLRLGTVDDLKIYHNGTDNYFFSGNGDFRFNNGSADLAKITQGGDIELNDNGEFRAGTGNDLKIYHNGTDSIIDNNTNDLEIHTADRVLIKPANGGEDSAIFSTNEVQLMYDGNEKFRTVTGGATITGVCTATSFAGDGSALTGVSAGATGGGSDEVFYENGQTVTTSYSITSNKNAMSAGPLSINSGAVVTIPSGSVWTIV